MDIEEKRYTQKEAIEKRNFIIVNVLRGVAWLGVIIGIYLLAEYFLPENLKDILKPFTERPLVMFSIYFFSETFMGIIPPEFFVIWAAEKSLPIFLFYMLLLAVLSWIGGLIAYWVGRRFHKSKFLKRFTQLESYQNYMRIYRRFGAIIIVISALTPLPYAFISFLSATFQFPLSKYLVYSASRFLRFVILGWLFWNINVP